MGDVRAFAVGVFRTICHRLGSKAADLELMVEAAAPFEEWLSWEAFLACRYRQSGDPFCEVAAKPTYASEGVTGDDGRHSPGAGGLRVGASYEADDHRWVFAEFVLLREGNRADDGWRREAEEGVARLLRLGWKRSAALLVVAVAGQGDVPAGWAAPLAGLAAWNRPALTDPFVLALPGGGTVVVKALDIKRDPAHTLTAPVV